MVDNTKKILVVDDSETNLFLVQSVLEMEPFIEVELEKDSRKAMRRIVKEIPDLVILDIMMPYVDGFEIMNEMRSNSITQSIPILIISAKDDAATIKKAKALHSVAYITKPITMLEIADKVLSIVRE